jgi:hypothetical protein
MKRRPGTEMHQEVLSKEMEIKNRIRYLYQKQKPGIYLLAKSADVIMMCSKFTSSKYY